MDTVAQAVRELAGLAGMLDEPLSDGVLARAKALRELLGVATPLEEAVAATTLVVRLGELGTYLLARWREIKHQDAKAAATLRLALVLCRMLASGQETQKFNTRAKNAVGWNDTSNRAADSELGLHIRTIRRHLIEQSSAGTKRRREIAEVCLAEAQRWRARVASQASRNRAELNESTRKLLSRSGRYWADLDIVSSSETGRTARLSEGMYVDRELQESLLASLTTDGAQDILIVGEAGHGKSSLLWWLCGSLAAIPDMTPILVSATWMVPPVARAPGSLLESDTISTVVTELKAAGQTPILLLDTADLLLHDEASREVVRDCLEVARTAGVRVALTCRPVEAKLLRTEALVSVFLGAYTKAEVALAVSSLANFFCPGAATDVQLDRIDQAIARGLPVTEVVTSPLLLRVLFELRSPAFPALQELDVTSLYEEYWHRRVTADVRDELSERGNRSDGDLSVCAGLAGVVLLGLGSPETAMEILARQAQAVANAWAAATPTAVTPGAVGDLPALVRRGVLLAGPLGTVRFFHQTFFEYAAAQGLIRRDDIGAVSRLLGIVLHAPEDLFTGAVLEQVLIILGRDPAAIPAVQESVQQLIESAEPGLQSIAMVMLAHYPSLALDQTTLLLDGCTPPTLLRFGNAAATVASSSVQPTLELLHRLWIRPAKDCHRLVLKTLCRLGQRDADAQLAVTVAAHKWEVVESFMQEPTAKIVSNPDVPALLRLMAPMRPDVVRSATLTLIRRTRDLTQTLLDCAADNWDALGSTEYLDELKSAVVEGQTANKDRDGKAVREALGRVYARQWSTIWNPLKTQLCPEEIRSWDDLLDSVCAGIVESHNDVDSAAQSAGLAHYLGSVVAESPLLRRSLDRMAAAPTNLWQLRRSFYPILLASKSPATDLLIRDFRVALHALPVAGNEGTGTTPTDGTRAAVARASLDETQVPDSIVLAVLRGLRELPDGLWLRPDGLVIFLTLAARGGHAVARRVLAAVRLNPGLLKDQAPTIVLARFDSPDRVQAEDVPLIIELCVRLGETAHLRTLSADSRLKREFSAYAARLQEFVDLLLAGTGGQQVLGANLWHTLVANGVLSTTREALDLAVQTTTDPRAKAMVLRLLTLHVGRHPEDTAASIAGIRQIITIEAHPTPKIGPATRKVQPIVVEAARETLMELHSRNHVLDPTDAEEVFLLTLAPRTDRDRSQDIDTYGPAGEYIASLARSGYVTPAIELLDRLVSPVSLAIFSENQKNGLANKLRMATKALASHSDSAELARLVRLVEQSEPTFARILANSLLGERFAATWPLLRELTPELLPAGVPEEIARTTRKQQRLVGASARPELLLPT